MRKQLLSIHKEKGFFLPSVLLLTTIVLLYLSTSLITYNHDVHISYNMMEQIKSQSLFQMAYAQYKKEYLSQNIVEENVEYSFPMGDASVKSTITDEIIILEFSIRTDNDFSYAVTKLSKTNW